MLHDKQDNVILPRNFLYRPLLLHVAGQCYPSQERFCTDLSYYMLHDKQDNIILSSNVYVHLSLIKIIANTSFSGTFMYCTVISYYNYSQYILPRNVCVQLSLITIIANTSFLGTFMYIVQFSLITFIANTSFQGTFMYRSLLLPL
jgi:hypothetical protein